MKLSKRRSTKRSYRKASPKKRASYRKKRTSPKKRTSYRKKVSRSKRASHGRRHRISFRFGDSIDPEYVTVASVSDDQKSLQARLGRIREHLADNPGKREIANGVINSIKEKYFAGHLNRILNRDVRGNDAFEFVCEKLNIKPQRLVSLIPTISELDPDKVTVDKIRLLMMAYAIQEMNNYVDTLEPPAPDVWRRRE